MSCTEVESTGRHGQFYEKFNIRYHIAVILKELWRVPDHRQRMIEQSQYVLNCPEHVSLTMTWKYVIRDL